METTAGWRLNEYEETFTVRGADPFAHHQCLVEEETIHERSTMSAMTEEECKAARIAKAKALGIPVSELNRIRKESTAYHEAGHATIARVLTLRAGSATIKTNYETGNAGVASVFDVCSITDEWEERGKIRGEDTAWLALIMTGMAGAEAEMEMLGHINDDSNDRRQILWMWKQLGRPWERFEERLEPRLRAMTRMLVHRHRARIERVAKALLAETTLSAEQLDELVGGHRRLF
jgi:hypothetical protein